MRMSSGDQTLGSQHRHIEAACASRERNAPGPTFAQYLADNNVKMVMQENYMDAVVVDKVSTRRLSNPAVKAHMGLPADGPWPGSGRPASATRRCSHR